MSSKLKNQVFTPEQQTIVKEVETVANKRYPHDKNLRSYIDYLEKDAFCGESFCRYAESQPLPAGDHLYF